MHRIYEAEPNDTLTIKAESSTEIYDELSACEKWGRVKPIVVGRLYEIEVLDKPSVHLRALQILGMTLNDNEPLVLSVPNPIKVLRELKLLNKTYIFTIDTTASTLTVIKSSTRRKGTSTGIDYTGVINKVNTEGQAELDVSTELDIRTVRTSLKRVAKTPVCTKMIGRTMHIWKKSSQQ